MGIVILRQDGKIDLWKKALQKAGPGIPIYSFLEDHPPEQVDMAIVWKHPKGSLKNYPNLKCIASFGAGVDFIFEDKERPSDVPVTRVVDPKLASDMSEFVLGQILAHLKHFFQYKLDQLNHKWEMRSYGRIADVSVGIMGMGALGRALAEDLLKLNFRVTGWANSSKDDMDIPISIGKEQRDSFLAGADILVCLLPLTTETAGILNEELFAKLPGGAYIINVARGGHLVDNDLLKMIDIGHLSGASLDVFHTEPLKKDHPFWNHPRIHLTPHIASVSDISSVTPQLVKNYQLMKSGMPLINLVSPAKGY